jgi:hypothetical protein
MDERGIWVSTKRLESEENQNCDGFFGIYFEMQITPCAEEYLSIKTRGFLVLSIALSTNLSK